MSDEYIKGSCSHCSGRISFPAAAAGSTIKCPHCAKPTVLTDPNSSSGGDNLKTQCVHCSGRISFPSYAAGSTINCPHCAKPTPLEAPGGTPAPAQPAQQPAPAAAPGPPGGGSAPVQPGGRLRSAESSKPVPKARIPRPSTLAAAKQGKKKILLAFAGGGGALLIVALAVVLMNVLGKGDSGGGGGFVGKGEGLEIMEFQLQKAQEGGLFYVVGTVTNHDPMQYFDVKVEFDLFDSAGQRISETSDYNGNLAPNDGWEFRALVLEEDIVKAEKKGEGVIGEPDTAK